MSDESTVVCSLRTGRIDRTVAAVVAACGSGDGLVLAWLEPVGAPTRIAAPVGLLPPGRLPQEPFPHPLVEARLFYEGGLLHLLADADHTRVAAWWEGEPDGQPSWVGAVCNSEDFRDASAPDAAAADRPSGAESADLQRKSRPILMNDARSQRGLRPVDDAIGSRVRAVEYFQDGQLRWWRIEGHG